MKTSSFVLISSLLLGVVLCIGYVIASFYPQYSFLSIAVAAGYCYLSTLITYFWAYPTLTRPFSQFMYAILGGMMVKFFMGIILIAIVAIRYKSSVKSFVIACFFSYFIFAFFEVYALMRNLRPFSKNQVDFSSQIREDEKISDKS